MTPAALAAIAAHLRKRRGAQALRKAFHVKHGSAPNGVSRETLEALEQFTSLLLRWNRTVNLVSRGMSRSSGTATLPIRSSSSR